MKTLLFFLVLLVSVAATAQVAPNAFTIDVVSNSELRLIWKHDGRGIDKFRIDRSLDGITYSPLKTINNTTDRSYTDAGLSPNTVYHYQIVSGLSLRFSDAVKDKATTLSNPPTGFNASTISPVRIDLV